MGLRSKFYISLSLFVVLTSCRTIRSQTHGDQNSTCPTPATVSYAESSIGTVSRIIPVDTTVGVGLFDLVNIEVKPEDFSHLDSHECQDDETCTAVMTKPVKVNVNVPVSLLSKISVTYEQAKGDKAGLCLRKVSIGTKISPPICLGPVLDFSIRMGLGLSRIEDNESEKVTYDLKPYCNANFSCSLPFISASARLDDKGLTFDSTASAKANIPSGLVKVSVPPTQSVSIPFPQLPESIQQLKNYFSKHNSSDGRTLALASHNPDIQWENFVIGCGP